MKNAKRAFTLIELLIVTVVIATLMGIVFRLAGVGGDSRKKAVTIDRMQRIENALSGYYAAYGSYPPVPLQGRSRSVYKAVDGNGLQETGSGETGKRTFSWDEMGEQILAACKAQPVAVNYPFNKQRDRELVQAMSTKRRLQDPSKPSYSVLQNVGGLNLDSSDWRECPLFQFGLLSFLLPRYAFMLEGDQELYDHVNTRTRRRGGQWAANNQLPCRLDTGEQYASWHDIQRAIRAGDSYKNASLSVDKSLVENLTSQSVCARWMPNFAGIVSGGKTFFGVDTADEENYSKATRAMPPGGYAGSGSSGSSLYALDGMTIVDGWGNEFFYYSEAPYGSYKIWSSGADGRTFPPWYDRSQLNASDLKAVTGWTADDISGLNN